MSAAYRLFGAETSPYSIKVRSFMRYKRLPHDWIQRSIDTEAEFSKLARTTALPLLVSAKGAVAQDSSAILGALQSAHPDRSIIPDDPICGFLAMIFEDYGDEWLNKVMFHHRWYNKTDAAAAAERQLDQMLGAHTHKDRDAAIGQISKSMSDRLPLVGSTKKTGPVIEASFKRFIGLLNAHLEHHLFLFGGCPTSGDFSLAGQLIQLMSDPTPSTFIRENAPFVTAWCEFMEDPRAGAPFESYEALKPTLVPLMKDEVTQTWLPWAAANAASVSKKRKTLDPVIADVKFRQNVQAHAAVSFKALQELAASLKDHEGFMDVLAETGLQDAFQPAS